MAWEPPSAHSLSNAMLQSEEKAQEGPLAPKQGQFPTKIKSCIFLTMSGGPSHIDTFDPKPKLDELHLKEFQRPGQVHLRDELRQTLLRGQSVQVQ